MRLRGILVLALLGGCSNGDDEETDPVSTDTDVPTETDTDTGDTDDTDDIEEPVDWSIFPTSEYDCYALVESRRLESGSLSSRRMWAIDPATDQWLYSAHEFDGDDALDWLFQYTYDAEGRILESYQLLNGEVEVSRYTYDADGNLTLYTVDVGDDGSFETEYTYTRDADGNLVLGIYAVEGQPTETVEITYDADGNRATYSLDADSDGTPDLLATYQGYTADGDWIEIEIDEDADGTADLRRVRTFDAALRILTEQERTIDDDTLQYQEIWSWPDDFGSFEHTVDEDGDGTDELREGQTYDADEQLLAQFEDEQDDGSLEYDYTATYHPDGYGPVTEDFQYINDSGPGSQYTETTYGPDGRIATSIEEYNGPTSTFPTIYEDTYTWTCP